ncbi:MAG: heme exporter protein CcmD [Candidatus Binatia bacterium]
MGHWGFVFLAYGLVWLAILGYLATLKLRLKKVEAELRSLPDFAARSGAPSGSWGAREKARS